MTELHGKMHVLSVGMDGKCRDGALAVRSAFLDVRQLNADPRNIVVMTPDTPSLPPDRETILAQLRSLASHERLLFYFSGPPSLLSDAIQILEKSAAKQKIVILDVVGGREPIANGFSILAGKEFNDQSPNPKLSNFTFHFVKALRGEPEALDDRVLTVASLFDYVSAHVPSYQNRIDGVLADFRHPFVSPKSTDAKAYPFTGVTFRASFAESTKAILTEWKDRSKTPEQLEWAANTPDAMAKYMEADFGEWRAALRKAFGFTAAQMGTDGGLFEFSGGSLGHKFVARNKDNGHIHRELTLDLDWFGNGPRISSLLALISFQPESFGLELKIPVMPLDQIAGLEANGWNIESESSDAVIATKNDVTLTVTASTLTYVGIDIDQLLAATGGPTPEQTLVTESLDAVASPKRLMASP